MLFALTNESSYKVTNALFMCLRMYVKGPLLLQES